MSWYEESLVYQIYPLGLLVAPYENDGTGPVEHRLPRLAGWVDHLRRLDVGCVLLNPVWESSMHGYDPRDLLTVDRRLGDMDDPRELVRTYHEAGIRVILDTVLNHVGRDFWAFRDVREHCQDSPYAGWFCIDWNGDSTFDDGFGYECWEGVGELVGLNHSNFDLNTWCADVIRT
jgi:cyclomaltodextrinase